MATDDDDDGGGGGGDDDNDIDGIDVCMRVHNALKWFRD